MSTQPEVKSISPKATYDLIQNQPKSLLIDVRSHMEFLFIGHPVGALHIPWIDEPDWEINPRFVADVRQLVLGGTSQANQSGQKQDSNDVAIILICRSGKRSKDAADLLIQKGFNSVYNVDTGFEGELNENHQRSSIAGWRFESLPWEQC